MDRPQRQETSDTNNPHAALLKMLPSLSGDYLDLYQLHPKQPEVVQQWTEELLSGNPQLLPFSPGASAPEIMGIYTSARNRHRQYGNAQLGLGFPLLLLRTTDGIYASPLFIWPILMEPEALGVDNWYIQPREKRHVLINMPLIRALHQETGIDLEENIRTLGPLPTWAAIRQLLEGLDNDFPNAEEAPFLLKPCPSLEILGHLGSDPKVYSSGILGIFPTILPFRDKRNLPWPESVRLPWSGHAFGLGALSPDQATAAEGVRNQKYSAVCGGPGTGKKYLAAHVLSNALSNGHKCLVVSNTLFPLKDIQSRLDQLGLGRHVFLLRDPQEDYLLLLDYLRAEIKGERTVAAFDSKSFHVVLDKLARVKDKLDSAYQSIRQPLLGGHNWTSTVGRFLQCNREEGKELLGAHLQAADFRLEEVEYLALSKAIKEAFPLYQKVRSLNHPLHALHPELYLQTRKEEARSIAEHKTKAFEARVSSLLHRYIFRINAYSDQLRAFLEDHYRKISLFADNMLDKIRDYSLELGPGFSNANHNALQISGAFSKHAKRIQEARQDIAAEIGRMNAASAPLRDFGIGKEPLQAPKNFRKLQDQIQQYREQLQRWYQELPSYVQEEALRLSGTHLHTHILPGSLILDLETEMDTLLQELNQTRLLSAPVAHQLLTLSKRQKFLESLAQQLETIRLSLRDFPEFYDWQQLWLPLPENGKKAIRALTNLKPKNWTAAWNSWYLDQALLKAQSLALPQENLPLQGYRDHWETLQTLLPKQMLALWQQRRAEVLQLLNRNKSFSNRLFRKAGAGQGQSLSLGELVSEYGSSFTDAFPVILATENAALEALTDAPDHLFEWVLFLDAQNIPADQAEHLLHLGQRVIAFGDNALAPASNSPGLMSRACASWEVYPLLTIHRLYGINPIQMLQAQRIPDMAAHAGGAMEIVEAGGRYHPQKRINPEEAERVAEFLLQKLPLHLHRTLPSVTVAAFTREQRDLIASKVLQLKRNSEQDADRIQQLERSGLGIYALDELSEVHSDILIVSSTFGPSASGTGFSADEEVLRRPETLVHLQRLCSLAFKQVVLLHSFPAPTLKQWSADGVQNGMGFWSNFLLLAAQWDEWKRPEVSQILDLFRAFLPPSEQTELYAAFWDSLAETIRPYIAPERIRRHFREAQFQFPLVIEPLDEKKPHLLICADGFWANTPNTDFCWELEQKQLYVQNGFLPVTVWSVNWWKQADQEARRLAGQLIRLEQNAG
ncbi:MAG: hypothetical protein IPI11_13170 [Haliscomenobacter sp.]|nr:hypothetical protein [Haliscomenobacter sp.]